MKRILLVSVFIIMAFSISAQKGVSFGLRFIPLVNWATTNDTSSVYTVNNEESNLGIGFGPSLRYKFSDNFNVDISGVFSWEKMTLMQSSDNSNPVDLDFTHNIKYQNLYIPLNFNGQFDVAGDFQALINFGVSPAIKLSQKRTVSDNLNPESTTTNITDPEKISSMTFIDIYLTAGVGAVYNIQENLHLSLTVQYNNGLFDGWLDRKEERIEFIEDLSLKHKNVAFSLGFYIDF